MKCMTFIPVPPPFLGSPRGTRQCSEEVVTSRPAQFAIAKIQKGASFGGQASCSKVRCKRRIISLIKAIGYDKQPQWL